MHNLHTYLEIKQMFKTIFTFFFLALITTTNTNAMNSYYPKKLAAVIKSGDGQELKNYLFTVLNSSHQKVKGDHDTLGCQRSGKGSCSSQISLGYKGARKVLFGNLHLEKDAEGYYIKDVYCRKEFRRRHTRMGPGQIPNHTVLNCEHTWPQSKFSTQFDKGMQKSDLHHLYPTDSHANSVRGNYAFGNINGDYVGSDCTASRTEGNGGRFEPPTEHRGNVARSLFYFSVRYNMKIDARQEQALREWHIQDPVDASERERNEMVNRVQKNRNPFVDMPELTETIKDF